MTIEQARLEAKKQIIDRFIKGRLVLVPCNGSSRRFYARAAHWQRGFQVDFETLVALRAEDLLSQAR